MNIDDLLDGIPLEMRALHRATIDYHALMYKQVDMVGKTPVFRCDHDGCISNTRLYEIQKRIHTQAFHYDEFEKYLKEQKIIK